MENIIIIQNTVNNPSTQSAIALRLMTLSVYGREKQNTGFLTFMREFSEMRKDSGATDELVKALTPTQEDIEYCRQKSRASESPVSDDVLKSLDSPTKTDE